MLGQTDQLYARMSGHYNNSLRKWLMAGSKIVHCIEVVLTLRYCLALEGYLPQSFQTIPMPAQMQPICNAYISFERHSHLNVHVCAQPLKIHSWGRGGRVDGNTLSCPMHVCTMYSVSIQHSSYASIIVPL